MLAVLLRDIWSWFAPWWYTVMWLIVSCTLCCRCITACPPYHSSVLVTCCCCSYITHASALFVQDWREWKIFAGITKILAWWLFISSRRKNYETMFSSCLISCRSLILYIYIYLFIFNSCCLPPGSCHRLVVVHKWCYYVLVCIFLSRFILCRAVRLVGHVFHCFMLWWKVPWSIKCLLYFVQKQTAGKIKKCNQFII